MSLEKDEVFIEFAEKGLDEIKKKILNLQVTIKNLGKSISTAISNKNISTAKGFSKQLNNTKKELDNQTITLKRYKLALSTIKREYKNSQNAIRKSAHATMQFRRYMLQGGLSVMFFGQSMKRTFSGIAMSAFSTFTSLTANTEMANNSVNQFAGAWTAVKFSIGEALNDAITPLMPKLITLLNKSIEFIQNHEGLVSFVIYLGIILGSIMAIGGSFILFKQGLEALRLAFLMMKEAGVGIWPAIKAAGLAIWPAIKTAGKVIWPAIKTAGKEIWSAIKTTGKAVWPAIKTAAKTAFTGIKTIVNSTMFSIILKVSAVIAIFTVLWGVFTGDKPTQKLLTNVVGVLIKIVAFVTKMLLYILAPFVFFGKVIYSGAKYGIKLLVNFFKNLFNGVINWVIDKVNTIINAINSLTGANFKNIAHIKIKTESAEDLKNTFDKEISGAWNDLKYIYSKDFSERWSNAQEDVIKNFGMALDKLAIFKKKGEDTTTQGDLASQLSQFSADAKDTADKNKSTAEKYEEVVNKFDFGVNKFLNGAPKNEGNQFYNWWTV